jgi:segregation and condensation protein B
VAHSAVAAVADPVAAGGVPVVEVAAEAVDASRSLETPYAMPTMRLLHGGAAMSIETSESMTSDADDVDIRSPEPSDESADGHVESETDARDEKLFQADKSEVDLARVEALLFATHHPLTAGRLGELLDLASTKPIRRAIQSLNDEYAKTGRSFRIEQVAGGYQMLTVPELGDLIKKLVQKETDAKLTKAAMETLAIIAYKQPILRVDVEAIRGVACGEAIRGLMEKHLVKIAGRAEEPGRPILYGTTKRFLEVFGLNATTDLPNPEKADAAFVATPSNGSIA